MLTLAIPYIRYTTIDTLLFALHVHLIIWLTHTFSSPVFSKILGWVQ